MMPDREPTVEGQNPVPLEVRERMDQAAPFIIMLAAQTRQSLRATTEQYAATVQAEIAAKEKQA